MVGNFLTGLSIILLCVGFFIAGYAYAIDKQHDIEKTKKN